MANPAIMDLLGGRPASQGGSGPPGAYGQAIAAGERSEARQENVAAERAKITANIARMEHELQGARERLARLGT